MRTLPLPLLPDNRPELDDYDRRALDRLMSRAVYNGECWEVHAKGSRGYPQFHYRGEKVAASRVAYRLLVGPIPDGFVIDHVKANGCLSTRCINPAHLEAVTVRINTLRGTGPSAINAMKTHCHKGHELTDDNIYRQPARPKRRFCRECQRLHDQGRPR